MTQKIRVGIIFGGRSGEHEVSLVSAQSVISALDKNKYEIIPIGLTRRGAWIIENNPLARLRAPDADSLPSEIILSPDPTSSAGLQKKVDIIFPVLHGPYGEDGTLQGLLELAGLPYVGSGVLGSAVAMDKVVQKQLAERAGLPVVKYYHFLTKYYQKDRKDIVKHCELIGYPLFIKPANLGSSVGISKVHNRDELIEGIDEALLYDQKIIVEKGIEPAYEIEVSVLGNDRPRASIPGEIIASNEFYDYNAKYIDGQSSDKIPAPLPKKILEKLQSLAINAFTITNCAGLARVDFLVHKGNHHIYLNELNTMPGFTSISMYPKLWAYSGLSYEKLLDKLISLGLERHRKKQRLATSYRPKSNWFK